MMTKDELIKEAQELLDRAPSDGNGLWLSQTNNARVLLNKMAIMLSRSIVWEDGEPPRDTDFFQGGNVHVLLELCVDGKYAYVVAYDYLPYKKCWATHSRTVEDSITRHAILTPQAIDWPGESPLEQTPETERECEQALEKSEKYIKGGWPPKGEENENRTAHFGENS